MSDYADSGLLADRVHLTAPRLAACVRPADMSHRTAYVASPGEALLGQVFPHLGPAPAAAAAAAAAYPPTPDTDDSDEQEFSQAEALLARSSARSATVAGGPVAAAASRRESIVASLQNWSRVLTQRSIARRLVYLAVAAAVSLATLYGAATQDPASGASQSRTLGRLGAAPARLKDAVYDRLSATVWSRYGTVSSQTGYEPLNVSHASNIPPHLFHGLDPACLRF